MSEEGTRTRGFAPGQKRPYWFWALMIWNFSYLAFMAPRMATIFWAKFQESRLAKQCVGYADCYYLKGSLRQEHVDEITARAGELQRLYVNTPGGQIGFGYQISKIIYDRDMSLHIISRCSSACVNYFIPAASKVFALNRPLIGSHGSQLEIAKRFADKGVDYRNGCKFRTTRWLDFLHEQNDLKPLYVMREIEYLGETKFQYEKTWNPDCPRLIEYEHAVSSWFPSRQQFMELLGIEIKGEICADNLKSCSKRIAPNKGYQKREKLVCVVQDMTTPCRTPRRAPLPWVKDKKES